MRVFCGMLIVAAAMAVAPAAVAQAPAGGTAYVVTYIEVVPSAQGEAAGLLKQVATASRKEAGNQRYDILQRLDRENQFVILEAWSDLKAAEAHAGGSALKEFKDKLKPMQASFYDERPSNGIAVAPAPGRSATARTAERGSLRDDLQPGLLPEGPQCRPRRARFSHSQGQNEPCHSLRRHGRSTSVSGPAGPAALPSRANCCREQPQQIFHRARLR